PPRHPRAFPTRRSSDLIHRQPDGVLRPVEVDDQTGLYALRLLVADADHLSAMRAPTKKLAIFAGLQLGNDATPLARPDVENGQYAGAASCIAIAAHAPDHVLAPGLRFSACCFSMASRAFFAAGDKRTATRSAIRMSTARISRPKRSFSWSMRI